MPRQPDKFNCCDKKWNFYVNEIDKSNYLLELAKAGKSRCQSAGLRALMFLYTTDEVVKNKVNAIVDEFLIVKENGKPSLM